MPRVPFVFSSLDGGSPPHDGLVFGTGAGGGGGGGGGSGSENNETLAAILDGESDLTRLTPYGVTIPPTNRAYRIRRFYVKSDDATKPLHLMVGASLQPQAVVQGGEGTIEFPSGLIVPINALVFVRYANTVSQASIAGFIDWEPATHGTL